jgi:hypothetical protein
MTSVRARRGTGNTRNKTIALEDAEYNDLALGSPSAFTRPVAAEHCLIEFHGAVEWLATLLGKRHRSSDTLIKSLTASVSRQMPETKTITGNTQRKIVEQLPLDGIA